MYDMPVRINRRRRTSVSCMCMDMYIICVYIMYIQMYMYMYMCNVHVLCVYLVHAAVMAINEVLEKEDSDETLRALQNPAACLVEVQIKNAPRYQVCLLNAKRDKTAKAGAQVSS